MSLWSLLLPDKWDLLVILFYLVVAMLSAVIWLLLAGIVILIGKVGRCIYVFITRFM
jgi:hypothetical protein